MCDLSKELFNSKQDRYSLERSLCSCIFSQLHYWIFLDFGYVVVDEVFYL